MQTIRASRFVSELKFRGSADLARAVEGMKEVLKVSKQTHYFLITDGSEVVYGTPFDLEISTTLIRYKNEMADKKLPFVVTLACQDGGFESYSVDSGGGSPIFIPKLVESEPEPPAQKQSKDRAQEEIFPDRKINLPGEKRVDEQKVDVGVKLPSDPEVEIGKKDPATAETNDASAPPPNIEGGHPEKMPSGSDSLREKSRKPSDSSISPPAEVYDEPLSGKQVMESSEPAASPKEAEINTDELEGPKSSSISVSPVTDSIISVGASIEKGLSPTTVEVEIASASASASGESRSEKNAEGTGGAVKEVVVSARPNVETNKVLKPEEDAETLAVLQPRVVMPEERRFPYLVVGLFGVVVLIGGIVLRGRGSSGESSIITQSFEKEE